MSNKHKKIYAIALSLLIISVSAGVKIFATNEKLNIAIISLSVGADRETFTKYTQKSLKEYSSKWGYDLRICDHLLDSSRSPLWNKIKLAIDTLNENKHDWVVWFDDDIFITNSNISLESLIKQHGKQADFIVSSHVTGASDYYDKNKDVFINSGMFLVKNTSWAKNFFKKVWDYGHGKNLRHHEQEAIGELMHSDEFRDTEKIIRLNAKKIQSSLIFFHIGDNGDYGQWEPGDFCAHMYGGKNIFRAHIFEQLAKNPNEYPSLPTSLKEYYTIKQDPAGKSHTEIMADLMKMGMEYNNNHKE